jgi:hypothetical protein
MVVRDVIALPIRTHLAFACERAHKGTLTGEGYLCVGRYHTTSTGVDRMVTQAFVSAVVMGLLVVGVFAAATRLNAAASTTTEGTKIQWYGATSRASVSERPDMLGFGFVVVALLAGVITLGAVGGLPMLSGSNPFGLIMAMLGVLIAGFLFLGPYTVVRQNDLSHALGVAAGIAGLGFAFLVLIIAQLAYGVV